MLSHIPTHLIAGPLGAGKTTLLSHLLTIKPAHERWAVLINEFGLIGLDHALLGESHEQLHISEMAGGCLCCVNGVLFQAGLARLLRQAKPDRVFIEPSGLGHSQSLLAQLSQAPWQSVLALQPTILVVDAQQVLAAQTVPETVQGLVAQAGLVWLSKDQAFSAAQRQQVEHALPEVALRWSTKGALVWQEIAGHDVAAGASRAAALPNTGAPVSAVWLKPELAILGVQEQADGWSIGWRWHPSQRFSPQRLEQWLQAWPWRRAKLVVQGEGAAYSMNALDRELSPWRSSEWRKDSRIELIFAQPQDQAALSEGLALCCL